MSTNAEIDGDEIVLKRYYDIGIAVDTPEGLVVPVIRDPQTANGDADAGFYFPGCGSERLFGQVGLDGKPVGFDVEIGKLIAAKLGRTIYQMLRTKQVFDEARFFAS